MSARHGVARPRTKRVRLLVEYSDQPGIAFVSPESFEDDRAAVDHLRAIASTGPFTSPVQAADKTWRIDLAGPVEGWARARVIDDFSLDEVLRAANGGA